jgi:hypothetical protein
MLISMKLPENLNFILLAIFLILFGLAGVCPVSLGHARIVVPISALAAGICLLIQIIEARK